MMNKTLPLISIGMPSYNGEDYIRQAIDSLLAQTYPNFELIISDDASADEMEAICKEYREKDRRVRYIRQEKNIGFVKNFNFVLSKAKGLYFMWAGQDDMWDKNFISKLINLWQKYPNAVLAMSNYQNLHGTKNYFVYKQVPFDNSWSKYQTLIHFLKTTNLSYFYGLHLTKTLRKVGGYHSDGRPITKSSDYVTIFKVLLEGKMIYEKKVLFLKRDTGFYTNRYQIIKKNFVRYETRSKIKRFLFYPFFYLYDAIYCIRFLFASNFTILQKIQLLYYILISFIKRVCGYLTDCIKVFT